MGNPSSICPVPVAHLTETEMFFQTSHYEFSGVFLRLDKVRPPLESPYSGPHQIIKRKDDPRFVILINDKEGAISV